MKYTLEIPDDEAAFITEVIRRLSAAVKLTPVRRAKTDAGSADTTEYLMSSPANAARLAASLTRIKGGAYTERALLPDAE